MGRRKFFLSKRVVSFAAEEDVYKRFLLRCKELGLTPSEVLREFISAFAVAEAEERRTITLNVTLNITKVERVEEKERRSAIELVRRYELEEFKEKLRLWRATVASTRNSIEVYDIKKAMMAWLRKLREVDGEVLDEAKALIELCNEKLEVLRSR